MKVVSCRKTQVCFLSLTKYVSQVMQTVKMTLCIFVNTDGTLKAVLLMGLLAF